MTIGVLLINTGTPDEPTEPAVRRFLAEFLADPRIIDINPVARWLLLHAVILRTRPARSAAAYRAIWGPGGSPLLVHSRALRDAVAATLGPGFRVALGMRYGNPSLAAALDELGEVERLVLLPLFPQYAEATTGSARERVAQLLRRRGPAPAPRIVDGFATDPGFIAAQAAVIDEARRAHDPEHVLFSFHGLPVRQVVRAESPTVACDRAGPCPPLSAANARCYRAQCYATARALAAALGLAADRTSVSFQSRLGRARWIAPYTENIIHNLRERGVRRLLVASPAFVADCLETLEELGIRLAEHWRALGGERLDLAPSLNAHPAWVGAVAGMVRQALG